MTENSGANAGAGAGGFFSTKQVPFGAKMGWAVSNEQERSQLLARLADQYQINVGHRSERQLRSLQFSDLTILQKFRHLVSLYYDLPTALLYFTHWPDERGQPSPIAFFLLRGTVPQITAVRYSVDAEVYDETVLEGELCPSAPSTTPSTTSSTPPMTPYFLVSDILVHKGQVLDHSLAYRLGLLQGLLGCRYRADPVMDAYQLQPKGAVEYGAMKSYFQQSFQPAHNRYAGLIKGLLFRPQNRFAKLWVLPLNASGDNQAVSVSWPSPPPPDENFPLWSYQPVAGPGEASGIPAYEGPPLDVHSTVDFFVVPGSKPDVYELYLPTPTPTPTPIPTPSTAPTEGLSRYGRGAVTTLENSLALQIAFDADNKSFHLLQRGHLKGLFLPARYVDRFKRWEPLAPNISQKA